MKFVSASSSKRQRVRGERGQASPDWQVTSLFDQLYGWADEEKSPILEYADTEIASQLLSSEAAARQLSREN